MSSSPQRAQRNTEVVGINAITEAIIGAAMKVHSALGPGCWKVRTKRAWFMSYAKRDSRSNNRLSYRLIMTEFALTLATELIWLLMIA